VSGPTTAFTRGYHHGSCAQEIVLWALQRKRYQREATRRYLERKAAREQAVTP